MSDLFADAAQERMSELAPLASRLRPRTLDDLPEAADLPDDALAVGAMDEFRGGEQQWLWMRPKSCTCGHDGN